MWLKKEMAYKRVKYKTACFVNYYRCFDCDRCRIEKKNKENCIVMVLEIKCMGMNL